MRICQFKKSGECPNKECTGQRVNHSNPSCPYKTLYSRTPTSLAARDNYNKTHAAERQAYRDAHKEEKREYSKKHRELNSEKYEAYRRRLDIVAKMSLMHHERRGMKVEVTVEQVLEMYKANSTCKYCGREMAPAKGIQSTSLTIDRVNNEQVLRADNVQLICAQCNMTKNNRTHDEFVAYMKNVLTLNQ